jgi:hypothetical protein
MNLQSKNSTKDTDAIKRPCLALELATEVTSQSRHSVGMEPVFVTRGESEQTVETKEQVRSEKVDNRHIIELTGGGMADI